MIETAADRRSRRSPFPLDPDKLCWEVHMTIFSILLVLLLVLLPGVGATDSQEILYDRPREQPTDEQFTTFTDTVRDRSIRILIVFPVSEPSPSPLIVLTHGFLLNGEAYRSYAEHMASHGFVVALPTLSMSLFSLDHRELARDVAFVIEACLQANATPGHPLESRIDAERIGVAGHSLGGKLSLMAALIDPRVSAAVLLDPVDAGGPGSTDDARYPSVTPERMGEISLPLLILGAEWGSVSSTLMPCAPQEENYQRFFEAANAPAVEITQIGAGHAQYVDSGPSRALLDAICPAGAASAEWVRTSSAAYMTAFFAATLRGEEAASDWLESRWAGDADQGLIRMRRHP